jgi:hypothetical protein
LALVTADGVNACLFTVVAALRTLIHIHAFATDELESCRTFATIERLLLLDLLLRSEIDACFLFSKTRIITAAIKVLSTVITCPSYIALAISDLE